VRQFVDIVYGMLFEREKLRWSGQGVDEKLEYIDGSDITTLL